MTTRIQLDGKDSGGAFVNLSQHASKYVTRVMAEENIDNFWDALSYLGKNSEDYFGVPEDQEELGDDENDD